MKIYSKYFNAFTLAEMMVVLLIMSIVLACMAPVMTTKMKAEQNVQTSPWKWVQQGAGRDLDAYFGNGNLQMAHIGQTQRGAADNAKLVINNSDFNNLLLFKNGDNVLGHLRINNDGLNIGTENDQAITIGHNVDGGFGSVAIGSNIMTHIDHHNQPSGYYNIALGVDVLSANTLGYYNEAIGWRALALNTTGHENVAVGELSLSNNTTGHNNTVLGASAGSGNTTGYNNTVLGASAGSGNTTGSNNTFLGASAGSGNTTGSNNVIIGHEANNNAVSDKSNLVVIGSGASGEGDNSIAIGSGATAGYSDSIVIGHNAQNEHWGYDTSGSIGIGSNIYLKAYGPNTVIGYNAMNKNGTSFSGRQRNTLIGYEVVNKLTTGGENTIIGHQAGYNTTIGSGNSVVGKNALFNNTSGSNNSAFGSESMYNSTSGQNNTAIGRWALFSNVSGSNNTAIGEGACQYVTGSNKTCIGYGSGPATSSEWAKDNVERIFIGSQSRFNNGAAVLEVHNGTARFGISKNNITSPETAVVVNGVLVVKGGIYTAMPKLGTNAYEATGGAEAFLLGSESGSPYIRSTYSAQTGFGDYFHGYGKFKHPSGVKDVDLIRSDRRLKYVGKENTDGLAKLRQLKIFNYTFKKDEKKTPRVGVMAQDLQKIFPNAVKKGADGFLTIRMEDMFYAVINAIKELDARISALEKENKLLKEQNKALDARLKALEAKIK